MSLESDIAMVLARFFDESVDDSKVVPVEHDFILARKLMDSFDIKHKEPEWNGPYVEADIKLDEAIENLRAAARNDRVLGLGYGQFD